MLSRNGETVVLMMDQSHICEDLQCLMIPARFGERSQFCGRSKRQRGILILPNRKNYLTK
jgi:hypothetical protein